MSRHAREKNPEIRPSCELPLFEQNFYKFAGERSTDAPTRAMTVSSPAIQPCLTAPLSANGESGDCRSGAQPPCSPRDVAHARRTDPATSKQAAARIANLGPVREAILEILSLSHGMTDEEIRESYRLMAHRNFPKVSPSGLRSRRSELVTLGFVEDSGELGKTEMGNPAIIWRLRK